MDVAVLGSGVVGRTLAAKIASLGHGVTMGTRDVDALMSSAATGPMTPETFATWRAGHPGIEVSTFAGATSLSGLVINATSGSATLVALEAAGRENLDGKILVDVSNPLDFSGGFPPVLSVSNSDSLGEQVQRAFPGARVVKTLNTVNAAVMTDPGSIGGGDHHVFLSGNDAAAKAEVEGILREWFGWRHVIDLGDISTSRGPEMYLPLWVRLMGLLQTTSFNIRIVT